MLHFLYTFAANCTPKGGTFLWFPTWYKYLGGITAPNGVGNPDACIPKIVALSDIWLIVAAFIEILLRLAGIAAVAYVIMGGFQYVTSQGEPDKASKARSVIMNALIGLVIAISATILVTYIAGRFK